MAEYLTVHNSELEKQKNAEMDAIKRAYKPGMHFSDLVKILKTSETTLRRRIKEYNIPGIITAKNMMRSFDDLSWWYDANLTVDEMAEKSGVKPSIIRGAIIYRKLPYKRIRMVYMSDLKWYDPNKTVDEMADETGILRANISSLLRSRGLPFKKIRREVDITDWYDAHFTIKEMVDKSGKSENSIRKILANRHLPFKRERK
jgi:DNA-binding Lrp family transcriptional regulator